MDILTDSNALENWTKLLTHHLYVTTGKYGKQEKKVIEADNCVTVNHTLYRSNSTSDFVERMTLSPKDMTKPAMVHIEELSPDFPYRSILVMVWSPRTGAWEQISDQRTFAQLEKDQTDKHNKRLEQGREEFLASLPRDQWKLWQTKWDKASEQMKQVPEDLPDFIKQQKPQ